VPVHYREGAFPPEARLDWPALIPLVGPAAAAVGRYDGVLAALPNPAVLLSALSTREAVHSSRIEGIQATVSEVLEYEAGGGAVPRRRGDLEEVVSCRMAFRQAELLLTQLPLCGRVIRFAHSRLLAGPRGRGKSPGEYRRTPNWIGPPGSSIDEATFVPVPAHTLPAKMDAWERYVNRSAPDQLVQLAVSHAEFEVLHPFLDGNGRVGRMLVPLFMWKRGLLRVPFFYLSGYLEAHRETYYERLLAVSRDDDWTGWCKFFLEAVRVQAEENCAKVQRIVDLYRETKSRGASATRSRYAEIAVDWVFAHPITDNSSFARACGMMNRTARRLMRALNEKGILTELRPAAGRRGALYAFADLLAIVEE